MGGEDIFTVSLHDGGVCKCGSEAKGFITSDCSKTLYCCTSY